MKSRIAAFFIVLALLLTMAVSQRLYVRRTVEEFMALTDEAGASAVENDAEGAARLAARLSARFDEENHRLSAMLDHEYICGAKEQLSLMTHHIKRGDLKEAAAHAAALKHSLKCVYDLEEVNAENIF